jgi:hypothetical protein
MIAEIVFHLDIVLGSLFVALPAIITAWNTRKLPVALPEMKEAIVAQGEKLEIVHQATNGMSAKIEKAAFVAGVQSEKDKK